MRVPLRLHRDLRPGRAHAGSAALRLALLLALTAALTLTGSDSARAHRGLVIGSAGLDRYTATWIEDADIAWAVFGTLPAGGTQHLIFMRPTSGQFRARVLVGTSQSNLRLNPWLALVGPGLDRPAGLEGLLGEGEGAILVAPPADREVELNPLIAPFLVLVGASLELTLPADGPYYLLVFDPTGQPGPYLVDIGYLQD